MMNDIEKIKNEEEWDKEVDLGDLELVSGTYCVDDPLPNHDFSMFDSWPQWCKNNLKNGYVASSNEQIKKQIENFFQKMPQAKVCLYFYWKIKND